MAGEELYGVPLERFVAERTALAKRLRAEGDREGADAVQALRKPTVSAWAVNQLARRKSKEMKELVRSAERLRRAHGGKEATFKEAVAAERRARGALVACARKILEEEDRAPSDAVLQRVERTLQAVAGNPDASHAALAGTLVEDLEPAGFESLAGIRPPARPPATKGQARTTPKPDTGELEAKLTTARARARELRAEAKQAARAAERSERLATEADSEVERLEARLRAAR